MEWRPIETAETRDGVLLYSPKFGTQMGRTYRHSNGEVTAVSYGFHGDWEITHWMPLPPPPGESAGVRMLRKQLEGACADCGRRYGDAFGFPDLIIPDDAWKAISPRGDEGGLLCPSCICRRLHEAGIKTTGRFTSGPLCDGHLPPGEAPAADLPVRNERPRG